MRYLAIIALCLSCSSAPPPPPSDAQREKIITVLRMVIRAMESVPMDASAPADASAELPRSI